VIQYCLLVLGFFVFLSANGQVHVNEFVASNANGIQDADGNHPDWIELYNSSNIAVDLKDYSIADANEEDAKWFFPAITIAPKSFLLVFASGLDRQNVNELHTDFKISKSGEDLFLYNAQGNVISTVISTSLDEDQSYGSIPDGSSAYVYFSEPTPGATNSGSRSINASKQSSYYTNGFDLKLSSANPCIEIKYTLDGEEPTKSSFLYSGPIPISNLQDDSGRLSNIPTTPLTGPSILNFFKWKKPERVSRVNTVNYAGYCNDTLVTPVYHKTYVNMDIGDLHQFPIVSIVTDSVNLFDYDTGIYVPGSYLDNSGWSGGFPPGNYSLRGNAWERNIHVSYFSEDKKLEWATNAGMRMRGGGSVSFAQKSFTLYFRDEYGRSAIEYPFFNGFNFKEYKRLAFRNSGNDFVQTHFRDAMLQSLLTDFDVELQQTKPSVVYIDGEYWGIHNIREKHDKHFFHELTGIGKDSFDILNTCGVIDEGDNTDFMALQDYLITNTLHGDAKYNYVASLVDVDNVIDYFIAQIYTANYDWPYSNMKLWKSKRPGSKWRYIIYDLDFTFNQDNSSGFWVNSLEHTLDTSATWGRQECSNRIFRRLLDNENFRDKFIARFAHHLNNAFSTRNVNAAIADFEARFRPEMDEHIARWGYPSDIEGWQGNVNALRSFAKERPCVMLEDLLEYFELSTMDFQCVDSLDSPFDIEDIIVAPNPVNSNYLVVKNINQDLIKGDYEIIDVTGQILLQGQLGVYPLKIDVACLTNGIYWIRVLRNDSYASSKFVLMR
jgi:hypothetical protein